MTVATKRFNGTRNNDEEEKEMNIDALWANLSKASKIIAHNTESVSSINERLNGAIEIIKPVIKQVDKNTNDITLLTDDITEMKLSYEITDTQKDIILDNAKRRVMEILSYDEDNVARYFRTFISSLYNDMKKYKGLGSKVATTKKRNYDNVIEGIDAWVPECGINNLKIKVDSRASANKRAKAAGY